MIKYFDFWCFWLGNWGVGEMKRGEVITGVSNLKPDRLIEEYYLFMISKFDDL